MAQENSETPDEVLVVAAILGDLESFGELAARYRAGVLRTAQAIVGREDAEDVAQDALLLAFKALPSIEEPTRFAAWLNAITRHRALRFVKERAPDKRLVELDAALLERIETLRARPVSNANETNDELQFALGRIPDDYALVLRMHFLDEMPLKRIAAFLGVPLSTVKWRVHQGKKLLRAQIETLRGET
jgi:RNA polymerase sigma-70 factor (ECF subfamily)